MEKKYLRDKYIYLLMVAIVTIVYICVLLIKQIPPFGDNTFIINDGYLQGVPFTYFLWDVLHGEKSLFFDWEIAFGTNMAGVSSFWLLNPLNLVYYFIPRNQIVESMVWMTYLRLLLMSFSFLYFLRNVYEKRLNYAVEILLTCGYCFSSWVFHYAYFPQWLDEAILLPLCFAFVIRLMENGHNRCRYCVVLVIILLTNVQQGYQILLSIVLFGGLYIICKKSNGEERRKAVARLGIYTIIAIGISAVALLPAAIQIMDSARLSNAEMGIIEGVFKANFVEDVAIREKRLIFRSTFIFMLANVLLILYRRIRRYKISKGIVLSFSFSVVMILQVYVESIHLIWEGGSYICFPLRGGYLFIFSVLYCSAKIVSELDMETLEGKIYAWIMQKRVCCICLIIASTLWGVWWGKATLQIWPIDRENNFIYQSEHIYDQWSDISSPLVRFKNADVSLACNYPLVAGISANANFIHQLPSDILETNRVLGYGQTFTKLNDAGGTVFSDALLGYQYIIAKQEQNTNLYSVCEERNDTKLYLNNYAYPIGVFLKNKPGHDILSDPKMSPFAVQNQIAKSVLGYEIMEEYTYAKDCTQMSLNVEEESAVYLYVRDQKELGHNGVKIEVNNSPIAIPSYEDMNNTIYAPEFNSGIILLGVYSKGEDIQIDLDGQVANEINIAICDLNKMKNSVPETVIKEYKEQKDLLEFVVSNTTEETQTLFLPFSNIRGMKCYVNGEKANIETVFGAYMGIEVPNGDNTIILKYTYPGLKLGLLISVFCLLLLCLDSKWSLYEKIECEPVLWLAYITFWGMFGLIFVIGFSGNLVCRLIYMLGLI